MAVPKDRRGLWGNWLVEQRAAHGRQTQKAVRDTLDKMGHPISEAYYGDFERGKSTPSAEWQEVFGRLWGSLPVPLPEPEHQPDLAAAIAELVSEVRLSRLAQETTAEALSELVGYVGRLLIREGTRDGLEPADGVGTRRGQ